MKTCCGLTEDERTSWQICAKKHKVIYFKRGYHHGSEWVHSVRGQSSETPACKFSK